MADKKLSLIVDLVNKTEGHFKKIYSDIDETTKKMENTSRALKTAGIVGVAAFGAIALASKKFLSDAAQLEQANVSFKTMLGSGAAATKMLEDLSDFAAKTPFELQGIRGTAKQLLAMGTPAKDMIPTLKSLGDVSSGLSVELGRLSYNYGQVRTQNKLTGVEMKDFMRMGVPMIQVLAQTLGVTENKIKDMVSAGEVGFDAVEEAFRQMSAEGGQFANMMGEQSLTLNGMMSNLQDNLTKTSETIGMILLPTAKKFADVALKVTSAVQAWVEENPELTVTILRVSAALAGLLMLMGAAGLVMTSARAIGLIRMLATTFSALGKTIAYVRATSVTQFLSTLVGPFVRAFKAARVAIAGATVSLKTFRAALITTGVGALIVGLGFLIMHLMDVKEKVGSTGKTIKYVFTEAKLLIYKFVKAIYDAANAVQEFFGSTNETFKQVSEAMQYEIDEMNSALHELEFGTKGSGDAASAAAAAILAASEQNVTSFSNVTSAAEDQEKAAQEYFDSIVTAVKEVRDEIKTTFAEYKSAVEDFNKSVLGEQKSYEGKIAETVAKAYDERADYERQLEDELEKDREDRDSKAIRDLKRKIEEQSDILRSYEETGLDLSEQISLEKKKMQMDTIQLLTFEHQEKIRLMKDEYTQEQAQRVQRLIALKDEQTKIIALVGQEQLARINAEISKTATVREQLDLQKHALSDWIGESLRMYANYVASANATLSEIGSGGTSASRLLRDALKYSTAPTLFGRASGGAVQPTRSFVVGENGPEVFTPSTFGRISTGGSGPNITLVFKDNHFTDEEYAEKIQRKIVNDLTRTMKLSIN